MKLNRVTIAVATVITLAAGGTFAYFKNQSPKPANTRQVADQRQGKPLQAELKDVTGDQFDELFINQMIEHHQGAIAMAELVDTEAKHEELRRIAQDIITAQTKEINDMKTWAQTWGYTVQEPSQKSIDAMIEGVKGKTGDDLDHQFMKDMIAHHKDAINMVTYVNTNAKHAELKKMAEDILVTQSMEIGMMQDWAKSWGYDLGPSGPGMAGHQM